MLPQKKRKRKLPGVFRAASASGVEGENYFFFAAFLAAFFTAFFAAFFLAAMNLTPVPIALGWSVSLQNSQACCGACIELETPEASNFVRSDKKTSTGCVSGDRHHLA